MSIALGAQTACGFTTRDSSGNLVDAATATITITQPDGTAFAPAPTLAGGTITRTAVGTYVAFVTPAQVGWHSWSAAGTLAAGGAYATIPDSFTVQAATPGAGNVEAPLVSLAETKTYLRVSATDSDGLIAALSLVATKICESSKGTNRVWRRLTITDVIDGEGKPVIRLTRTPVISVTSISESGVVLSTTPGTDWVLDRSAGLLTRGPAAAVPGPGAQWWFPGNQNITVTYVAGTVGAVPENVRIGVLEMTKHLYETQRGPTNLPRQSGASTEWDPRMAYVIPHRVRELWSPDKAGAIG